MTGRIQGVMHDRLVIRVKPDPEGQTSSTCFRLGRFFMPPVYHN